MATPPLLRRTSHPLDHRLPPLKGNHSFFRAALEGCLPFSETDHPECSREAAALLQRYWDHCQQPLGPTPTPPPALPGHTVVVLTVRSLQHVMVATEDPLDLRAGGFVIPPPLQLAHPDRLWVLALEDASRFVLCLLAGVDCTRISTWGRVPPPLRRAEMALTVPQARKLRTGAPVCYLARLLAPDLNLESCRRAAALWMPEAHAEVDECERWLAKPEELPLTLALLTVVALVMRDHGVTRRLFHACWRQFRHMVRTGDYAWPRQRFDRTSGVLSVVAEEGPSPVPLHQQVLTTRAQEVRRLLARWFDRHISPRPTDRERFGLTAGLLHQALEEFRTMPQMWARLMVLVLKGPSAWQFHVPVSLDAQALYTLVEEQLHGRALMEWADRLTFQRLLDAGAELEYWYWPALSQTEWMDLVRDTVGGVEGCSHPEITTAPIYDRERGGHGTLVVLPSALRQQLARLAHLSGVRLYTDHDETGHTHDTLTHLPLFFVLQEALWTTTTAAGAVRWWQTLRTWFDPQAEPTQGVPAYLETVTAQLIGLVYRLLRVSYGTNFESQLPLLLGALCTAGQNIEFDPDLDEAQWHSLQRGVLQGGQTPKVRQVRQWLRRVQPRGPAPPEYVLAVLALFTEPHETVPLDALEYLTYGWTMSSAHLGRPRLCELPRFCRQLTPAVMTGRDLMPTAATDAQWWTRWGAGYLAQQLQALGGLTETRIIEGMHLVGRALRLIEETFRGDCYAYPDQYPTFRPPAVMKGGAFHPAETTLMVRTRLPNPQSLVSSYLVDELETVGGRLHYDEIFGLDSEDVYHPPGVIDQGLRAHAYKCRKQARLAEEAKATEEAAQAKRVCRPAVAEASKPVLPAPSYLGVSRMTPPPPSPPADPPGPAVAIGGQPVSYQELTDLQIALQASQEASLRAPGENTVWDQWSRSAAAGAPLTTDTTGFGTTLDTRLGHGSMDSLVW